MVTKKYLDSMLAELEGRAPVSIHALNGDIDILSRRITNGFNYITTIMAEHEDRFHAKKKAVERRTDGKFAVKKRHSPEKLNKLIETIRKA